jgi:hypothetical protein
MRESGRQVHMGPGHTIPYPTLRLQRQEALARLGAGETQADVAPTYNVDATTIGRVLH